MGKSTLLEKLRMNLPGWQVLHTGGPKTDEELEAICERVEALEEPTILDRAPQLSEIVYRPLKPDAIPLSKAGEARLLASIIRCDPAVIYCHREVWGDAFRELTLTPRPHKSAAWWALVRENYPGIVDRYVSLMDRTRPLLTTYRYDWTKDPDANELGVWLQKAVWRMGGGACVD